MTTNETNEATENKYYNIIGKRGLALWVSGILLAVGIVSFTAAGLNFGIDFRGGFLLHMKFDNVVTENAIRSTIGQEKFRISPREIQVQMVVNELTVKESNEFIVYIPKNQEEFEGDQKATEIEKMAKVNQTIKEIKAELTEKLKVKEFMRQEFVGPAIGRRLRTQALYSCIVALIGILIYISMRFDLKFATAAIIALIHDVWITLAIFSLFKIEINMTFIAAILTIIGYSLNDTIVISDRIRENLKLLRKHAYKDIINISINQSLSRTINTSVTTFIPVLMLYLFGGAVLKTLSQALLIGVVVGTYSSIFVVSPIIVSWKEYEDKKIKVVSKN
jgi:preprotein translocase subunit SecF